MIDYFSIALTHGLIMVAAWRLLMRADLDVDIDDGPAPERPWLKNQENPASDSTKASADA